MHHFVKPALTAAMMSLLLFAAPALAETVTLTAELNGANAVPPVDTPATGKVEATFDTETKAFAWTITYEGLKAPATAAHFHGPATAEENASPVLPIEGDLASPIAGNATLTDEQAQQLQDGLWYFNVHTSQHPEGEIRGQLAKGMGGK